MKIEDTPLGGSAFKQDALNNLYGWATRSPFFVIENGTPQAIVGRYQDVLDAFSNTEAFSSALPTGPGYEQFDKFMGHQFITQMDGEQHGRLRRLMMPAFAPKRIAQIEGDIAATIDGFLDAIEAKGPAFDAMQDYAAHLVVGVMLKSMMGLNDTQAQVLVEFQDAQRLVSQMQPGDPWPARLVAAYEKTREAINAVVESRSANAKSDFLQDLLSARDEDAQISDAEFFSIVIGTFAALATTPRSTSGALYMLFTHPDQLNEIRRDFSLLPNAIEECLRIAGNGYFTFPRITTREIELGGTVIPKGIVVRPSPMAANLDPTVFPDPLKFDIHRNPSRIMTFGAGPHRCLGNILGRKVVTAAVRMLIERFPHARLADPKFKPVYEGSTGELRMRNLPMLTR